MPTGIRLLLQIAACALTRDARLWTLNAKDFAEVPGLGLYPG